MKRFSKLFLIYSLILSASLSAAISTGVRLNSVGFLPGRVKRASILGAGAVAFNVRRAADASSAFSGTLSAAATNPDSGESLRTADFTGLTETGSFYLDVSGLGQSPTFQISPDVYNDPFWAEVMGFDIRRCGTAASFTWKGQTYSHGACHLNDANLGHVGGGGIRDATEGWHDAGDYGKYTVNAAFATAMMLQAWEWHKAVLATWLFPIPESGGPIPDYLAEMKWNLDWLLKMQAADGAAYHKDTGDNFAGFVMPEADNTQTFFFPKSSAATADLCAVMSMAARIYQPYDSAYAATCRAVADKAWTWLLANPGELLVGSGNQGGTGTYEEALSPGVDDPDHRVWAAAEYWETSGNAAALTDFETRMAADADGVSTYWDWGEHNYGKRGPKNDGIFTYLLSSRSGRNAARVTALSNDLKAEADGIVAARNAHGYGRPLGTVYHWGSNGTVARQVMLLDAADQLYPSATYQDTMVDALGFIYGRNMYDRSFVTGVGYNPPMNPHDRLSASDGISNPVPGHLVGGAESTADSWTDTQGDYTTNEIAINWDGALVAALAHFVTVPPPSTPTPTPSPTPCFSTTALRRVNAGGPTVNTGGNSWSADQAYSVGGWGYTGGAVSTNGNAIAGTTDDVLYNTGRYGMSNYQFSVANGSYRVELYFAETYFNSAGSRVMSVTLEGQPAVTTLDIYGTVGGSTALVLTRDTSVSDGILTIGFSASADSPEIRAIAIYPATACPSTPTYTRTPNWTATITPTRSPSFTVSPTLTPSGTVTPTPSASPTPCGSVVVARINAGGGAYTDSQGALWSADTAYTGGTAASVANAIAGTTDDTLYQSERYGTPLAYAIPVPAPGSYQVRFLWAETYQTSVGARVFSVTLEGAAAVTNLDLYAAAGANNAYQLTRTVTVNDGVLNIAATASVDNAKFDGIEVLQVLAPCSSPTPSVTAAPPSATPSRTPSRSPSASPTASPTGTPSPSPSPTPSLSPSRSASPSVSPSVTPSASLTPSASASPTLTPSPAPASPTRTDSATASPTRSLTPSPGAASATATPSLSASPTRSPAATASSSPTLSASRTPSPSPSASRTVSPSVSPSPTSPPPGSSPTASPTMTPSGTGSVTPSQTPTRSPSFSASPTPSASPSATLSVTATLGASRTESPSATPVPSSTGTPTSLATLVPSLTSTPTSAATPAPSATSTPTPTTIATQAPSLTATPTTAATQAPSGTATPTPTRTRTPSPTATWTPSPSASPTAAPGVPVITGLSPGNGSSAGGWVLTVQGAQFAPGAQVTLGGVSVNANVTGPAQILVSMPALSPGTYAVQVSNGPGQLSNSVDVVIAGPVAAPTEGPLVILDAAFMPNPVHGGAVQLRFKLGAAADSLRLRLYSRALVVLSEQRRQGAWAAGWQSLSVDLGGLPAGLCFATIEAEDGARKSLPLKPLRLFILP